MIRRAVLADAPAIARVHVDSWRETYQGMVSDDFLASLSYDQREQMWRRGLENPDWQGRMFVAEAEGQVVGFVAGGQPQNLLPDFDCELWAIYLLKAHQGKGLGRLLFQHFVREMLAQHKQAMTLWVLAENPTCRFYEHMGGVKVGETEIEIGGKKLLEFAYGWRDLKGSCSVSINYHNRFFRSVENTPNGEVSGDTRFHYTQEADIVSGSYSGGGIVKGQLMAKVLPDGSLEMRYHHLNQQGEFMLGKCFSRPEVLPDGRIRLHEEWQWLSGDGSKGHSVVEETR